MMKRQRSSAHKPRRRPAISSSSLANSAWMAALSFCSTSCALHVLSLTIFLANNGVDAFSVPSSLHKGIAIGPFHSTNDASGSTLQLYPTGYRPYEAPRKRISPCDPSKYVPVSASASASNDLDDNESPARKADISQILNLTRKDKRQVYIPQHLQQPAQRTSTGNAVVAADSGSKPSWRLRMVQNMIDKRQSRLRRRLRLRSFIRRLTRVAGLSLALWQVVVTTGSSMDESPGHAQRHTPVARQDPTRSMNSDSTSTGKTAVMAFKSRSKNIVVTSRGGGRRGKTVAPPPSARECIRSKIVNIASQSKSMVKGGVDRTVDFYRSADPNKKAAVGIVGAVAVGVGIGVEVAGRNDEKQDDDGEVLSNTDKLRKEIMDEIDWYNERYGAKGNEASADDVNVPDVASDNSTPSASPSSSPVPPSPSGGIRKPDPQAQVKAILQNAKEAERRARQARREGPGSIAPPPTTASGGVDYSQVKGLSTKEGDGKSRAQLLIETTARMEQKAEAQRLEMSRQRDFAEEQEARRVQESLKNRIDNFIAVTEAEEKNQGFGNRPGDQGRALRQEISRLNGELDLSRNKVAVLEAELEEKKKIEVLLRQEIDRLRRSG